jgi:hypothetical protein
VFGCIAVRFSTAFFAFRRIACFTFWRIAWRLAHQAPVRQSSKNLRNPRIFASRQEKFYTVPPLAGKPENIRAKERTFTLPLQNLNKEIIIFQYVIFLCPNFNQSGEIHGFLRDSGPCPVVIDKVIHRISGFPHPMRLRRNLGPIFLGYIVEFEDGIPAATLAPHPMRIRPNAPSG